MINTNWTQSFICESFTEASNMKDAIDSEYAGRLVTAVTGRVLFVCPVNEFEFTSLAPTSGESVVTVVRKIHARLASAASGSGAGVSYR